MYISSTPKLFDLIAIIQSRVEKELPELWAHLFEYQIYLEVPLASPLMTLFSNSVNFIESTHIMNMFLLEGEQFIIALIMNIYKQMTPRILQLNDEYELLTFMTKTIYKQALDDGLFYPQ